MTGCNQGLFICERDLLAGFNRGYCGAHADHSHNGGDKIVIPFHGRHFQNSVHARENLYIQIRHSDPKVPGSLFVPHHCRFRSELANLGFYQIYALSGAQRCNFDVLLLSGNVQSLPSDGTGRT